jgi:hypothetical protein
LKTFGTGTNIYSVAWHWVWIWVGPHATRLLCVEYTLGYACGVLTLEPLLNRLDDLQAIYQSSCTEIHTFSPFHFFHAVPSSHCLFPKCETNALLNARVGHHIHMTALTDFSGVMDSVKCGAYSVNLASSILSGGAGRWSVRGRG